MWESRINPGMLDEFASWVRESAWPQFASAQGFLGGEAYRSDEQQIAVVVTRWSDADALVAGNAWFDLGCERFCPSEANAWEFAPIPLD
jgi:heme-degrading monooxygenase HmoA